MNATVDYADPEIPADLRGYSIGQRVRLVGRHPHSGSVGEIKSYERTPMGIGILVSLDSGLRAFVFSSRDFRLAK